MSVAPLDLQIVESICEIIGDTNEGLTGSEIARLLARTQIPDLEPALTKRHRIFAALSAKQTSDNCANNVLRFIEEFMNPVKYAAAHALFEERRHRINQLLLFAGLEIGEDGKAKTVSKVKTLSEAAQRASKLRKALLDRKVHSDVLKYCKEELVVENYFHAVFESAKSVADKIRERTGLTEDGAPLVDSVFSFRNKLPLLALNSLTTESEQSEQTGFMNLLKGLFGMFRNTTAHSPKIKWVICTASAENGI